MVFPYPFEQYPAVISILSDTNVPPHLNTPLEYIVTVHGQMPGTFSTECFALLFSFDWFLTDTPQAKIICDLTLI